MGSPQQPSRAQYAALEESRNLQQLSSPAWLCIQSIAVFALKFILPRRACLWLD